MLLFGRSGGFSSPEARMAIKQLRVVDVFWFCAALVFFGCSTGSSDQGGQGGSSSGSPDDGGAEGGSSPSDEAGADARNSDGGMCPANKPDVGSSCDIADDCSYGNVKCTCLDLGSPNAFWDCQGPVPEAGDAGQCPVEQPIDEPCPDAGDIENCRYDIIVCSCHPGENWVCII